MNLKTHGRPTPRPPTPTDPTPTVKGAGCEQSNIVRGPLATAFWWLALGVSLVPIQPFSKCNVRGFGAHQAQIITPEAARVWWGNRRANLGIVLGGLPGLICLDFDDWALFEAWRSGPGQNVQTRIEKTPRPGAHVFFVTTNPPTGKPVKGLEVKTSGVVVAAPSLGESGAAYELLSPGPITSFRSDYLPIAFFSLSKPKEPARPRSMPRGLRGNNLAKAIKQARPVADELARLFPQLVLKGNGQFKRGRCPFHDDEHASFWVNTESNLWGCLANSCRMSEASTGKRAHDVINLYAAAHGLTSAEAVRAMAGEEHLRASPRP